MKEAQISTYSKSKLLFFCSVFVMVLLLKITLFEESQILASESYTPYLQDNETEKIKKRIYFQPIPDIDYTNKTILNALISKVTKEHIKNKTRKPVRNFPFEEECFFERFPSKFNSSTNEQDFGILKANDYKTILAYHYAYGNSYGFGLGHKLFEAACCREKRCFMTDQRTKIPIEDFDAVMIHFRDFNIKNLPKKRKKHQRWIFYEREPPTLSSKNPEKYEGIFNWTMTFRSDSDIVSGYGKTYSKSQFPANYMRNINRNPSSPKAILKKKSKMAAWMVSHCNTISKRDQFAKKLQKFVDVDIYGGCGTLSCDRKDKIKCYKMIEKKYKFYLSFENSFCTDYITEKFFNLLNYDIIPVVRGAGNYSAVAPPNSYIDVQDFKSVKDLAKYLKYLASNDTAYLEYFKWRKDYFTMPMNWITHAASFCDLCYKLHNDPNKKIYYNLNDWFHRKSKCID